MDKAKLSRRKVLLDLLTCPFEVVQHSQRLLNGQNHKTELFSETRIILDLEVFVWDRGSLFFLARQCGLITKKTLFSKTTI